MPEDQKQYQRFPAVPRAVRSINVETDIRVRILGKIVDKLPNAVVLKDMEDTQTEIRFEKPVNFEVGRFVRVFARVLPLESGFELHGEIVQDMSDLDKDLHAKVFQ